MNHKFLAAAGLLAGAALVLSGCSTESPKGDAGPVTITYTNFISNDGNEANLAKIIAAFEKENPNITVDVKYIEESDLSGFNDPAGGKAAGAVGRTFQKLLAGAPAST